MEIKEVKEAVKGSIHKNLSGVFHASIVGILVLIQFGLIIYLSYVLRDIQYIYIHFCKCLV